MEGVAGWDGGPCEGGAEEASAGELRAERQASQVWVVLAYANTRDTTRLVGSRSMHPKLSPHGIVTRTKARLKPHVLDSLWSPNDPGLSQRRSSQG